MGRVRCIKMKTADFAALLNKDSEVLYFVNDEGSFSPNSLETDGKIYLGDKLVADGTPVYWSEILNKPSSFTPSAHDHARLITEGDYRSVSTLPSDYANTFRFRGLKNNSAINTPSSNTYSYLFGLKGWSDSSGGKAHELAFNDSGVFLRIEDQTQTSKWAAWQLLITSGNYTSWINTTNFPGLNKVGTVTSVALSAPTGFSVTGSPITTNGTLTLAFATGYSLPTTTSQLNWNTAYNLTHTHENKDVLDGITSTLVTLWNTAYTNNHTHSNKTVLDGITSTLVSNWDTAYTNSHTHSNKTVLDGITATLVSNWNTAYGWGNHYSEYLPLAGGIMTGAIKRSYTAASNDPVINISSLNQDIWIWRVSDGSYPYYTSAGYGFGLKYLGTGSGNENNLALFADNQSGTQVKAVEMKQDGTIDFKTTITKGGNTIWHAGNDGSGSGLDADKLDGLELHTGRNNEANKVVRTDASGYLQVGYINSSSGNENNNSSPDRVWGSNSSDSYLRTYRTSALSVGSAASAPWSGITNKPDTATRWPSWSEVTDKPSTFTPSSHTHDDRYYTETESDARFVRFNPGSTEQTILSGIGSLSEGVIDLWRNNGDYYTFLGFSNGTTKTYLGGIGFKSQSDHNFYRKYGDNYYKMWDENNDGSGSGLDADLLDGQHASYFATAASLGNYLPITGGTLTGALTAPSLNVTGASSFSQAINGSILGNAATASRLLNARTISLTGAVTGSGTFDGSGNLSIATTKNHTHAFSELTGTVANNQLANNSITIAGNSVALGGTLTTSTLQTSLGLGTAAYKNYTNSYSATSEDPITGKGVKAALDTLPTPMLFMGSVGTGGTITSLPAASASNNGYTYKVITALSTPVTAKVGDTVISNGTSWVVIPSGDEPSGTVTSVGLSAPTGFSVTGSPVTSSGTLALNFASGYSLPTTSSLNNWNTAYGWGNHAGLYLPLSGGTLSGGVTFNKVSNAISYTGTNATYAMIKFKDNAFDTYGNGIVIGGGGLVVVGSGESADSVAATHSSGGDEVLDLASDGPVYIWTNAQNGATDSSTKKFTFGNDGSFNSPGTITLGGTAVSLVGHTHSYLPLTGGTLSGPLVISTGSTNNNYNEGLRLTRASNNWAGITFGSTGTSGAPTGGWFAATNPNAQFIISPDDSLNTTGLTLNKAGNALWRNNIILHAGNYNSYSPTLTGTGASGTWGINITGNAATVTNGVYTTGNQTINGNKTFTGSTSMDDATIGNLVVTGGASFALTINGNIATADKVNHNLSFNNKTYNGSADVSITQSDLTSIIGSTTYAPYNSNGYLPLSGGAMTGIITKAAGNFLNFRTGHDDYNAIMGYYTPGNEALVLGLQNAVTSFIVKSGVNLNGISDWQETAIGTPSIQIKGLSLYVNSAIANGSTPSYNFYVGGSMGVSGLITSGVSTGTLPFAISSTTKVDNLNADLLDGKHASEFSLSGHTHSYLPLSGGTVTGVLTVNNLFTAGARVSSTSPSTESAVNRIAITPYFHTGGPWYIQSSDDSSNAYLRLTYGSTTILKIKHDGTFMTSLNASITGNAATATSATSATNSTYANSLAFERVSDMHATTGWRAFTLNNSSPSNGPGTSGWAQGITFLPNNDTGGYRHVLTFWGSGANNDLWIQNQWNGTWGDWRRLLNTAELTPYGNRNNSPSKIVTTDTNGYILAGWINTTSGYTTSTLDRIYASNDGYIRCVTPATLRSQVIEPYYVNKTGDTMTGALTVPSLNVTGASSFSLAINGSILGNAATASRLQNARTISLTGNASGSASFDGSGNISINTTVSACSNADTVDNEHAIAFAHREAMNNLVHGGNEITMVGSAYSGGLWFNYRTTGGTNGDITQYNFGNGAGSALASISNGAFSGSAAKLTTARNIALTGAVTGNANFDGSSNITISTSVNHTHNYAGSNSPGGAANTVVIISDNHDSTYPIVFHDNRNHLLSYSNFLNFNPSTGILWAYQLSTLTLDVLDTITCDNLYTYQDVYSYGDIYADGTINTAGDLEVSGDTTLGHDATVDSDLLVRNKLTVCNGAVILGGTYVLGNIEGDSNLTIGGNATINGDATIEGNDVYIGTASGNRCHQRYDATNKCLKFLFD